jgi:adenylate cyclase
MRAMHPLRSIFIYILVVMALYLVAVHITHFVLGRLDDLPVVYRRLPYGLSFFTAFSIIGILMMRVAHFIGLRTLLDLIIGTYHRPVEERKLLLFLDINGSTALGERLGALTMRAFVRKFLSDLSQPIVNHGGDIYLYKGDGLIAIWDWLDATRDDAILHAINEMFAAVEREGKAYRRSFGVVPSFRVGVHGGDVIVSEQGDARRSIGIYGDAINIAARMEEAARSHGVRCVISKIVVDALSDHSRIRAIGSEQVKGISAAIPICEYAPG